MDFTPPEHWVLVHLTPAPLTAEQASVVVRATEIVNHFTNSHLKGLTSDPEGYKLTTSTTNGETP